MIVVVSLNPALDITHRVDGADWAGVNRPDQVHVRAGGKGINVASVLHALGCDVVVTGLAGGHTGDVLRSRLDAGGIAAELTDIAGETRRTFAVVDSKRGETAIFNEPGPPVSADEYEAFRAVYTARLAGASVVVLSGSLPSGLPADTYSGLIAIAADAGVPALLDTSGEALILGAAAGPAVMKPNLAELEAATGCVLAWNGSDRAASVCAVASAADVLRGTGPSAVVVTLGRDGLLAVTGRETWHARSPAVSGNPTGAGDAVAAGLAAGMAAGLSWDDRAAQAAALGAATVAAPVAGEFDHAYYQRAAAGTRVSREDRTCR